MATPLPLEGDGLVENLFYFLWCKDDFGAGPRIFVPHTVLFRFAQPAAWYFTSLRSNKVKRKAKVNLTNAQIEHEFTKKRAPTDIVACYLYFADRDGPGSAAAERSATVIEYFDADALRDFLYRRDKAAGGMLQKFVLPKGTSNATVRAIWSPKICLLERRVNLRNVHDKRASVYERGVTFDGADVHSRPEPVRGAMLPGEVQLLCEQVVDHVTQVSYHKHRIARMVLHLKTDADDRLWLLWCSSLRLLNLNADESGGAIRPLDIVNDAQVPGFARLPFGQSSTARVAGLKEHKKLLATNYKAVLDHFQRFMRFLRQQVNESEHAAIEWPPDERFVQAAGGVGFGILQCFDKDAFSGGGGGGSSSVAKEAGRGGPGSSSLTRKELVIPPVIQYLHPSFSVDDFERHRHDPLFLHKPVAVCESCCLVYSDYTTSSLEVNSIRQAAPAILRPHLELSDAKKRLDPLDPLAAALAASHGKRSPPGSVARSRKKPPASAWKPVPDAKKMPRARGSQSALSSLPAAPQLPQRIDNFSELQSACFADLPGSGDSALGSSQSASALLQQREESFFRELHQQKDLERGHPLHHMLESATRLAASKRQQHQKAALRLSSTNTANAVSGAEGFGRSRSVGMLPELLEQQLAGRKAPSKSPYSVVLRLRESVSETDDGGDGAGDRQSNESSPTKRAKQLKKKKKTGKRTGAKKVRAGVKKDDKDDVGGDDNEQQPNIGTNAAIRFISSREKKASEEHQAFLFKALSQAEAQLDHVESLASLLPELTDNGQPVTVGSEARSDGDGDDSEEDDFHEDTDTDGERERGSEEFGQAEERDETCEDDVEALFLEPQADDRADQDANADRAKACDGSDSEQTEDVDRDQRPDEMPVAETDGGDEGDISDIAMDQSEDPCDRDSGEHHVEERSAACESGRVGVFESEQEPTQADCDMDNAEPTERHATEFQDDEGAAVAVAVDHNETEQEATRAVPQDIDPSADFKRFLDDLGALSSDTSHDDGLGGDSEQTPGGDFELGEGTDPEADAEQQLTRDLEAVVGDAQGHEASGDTQ
ncbi:hypothetical protein PybrP1_006080 [[Pythium] brassicae (nom. inval.)]|nr:hypothetical protein PybrP1_006080 [[Pythium] brassicae (nom. inval.)]